MRHSTALIAEARTRERPSDDTALLSLGLLFALAFAIASSLAGPVWSRAVMPDSFADLAEGLSPAVVNITSTTNVATPDQSLRPIIPEGSPFEDLFRDFLDRQQGGQRQQRRSSALGSGFLISEDGYIVTNNHVIEGADDVRVALAAQEHAGR